jgi:hypothetical protein
MIRGWGKKRHSRVEKSKKGERREICMVRLARGLVGYLYSWDGGFGDKEHSVDNARVA